MTQENLANMLGLKRSTISSWENQGIEPDLQSTYKLVLFSGFSFQDLCSRIILNDEIPDKPGRKIVTTDMEGQLSSEPLVRYDADKLIDTSALRQELQALKRRIETLESKIFKTENKQ